MAGDRELTTADIASPGVDAEPTGGPETSGDPLDSSAQATPAVVPTEEADASPLLPPVEAQRFSDDWTSVQGNFVDKPREAVEQADRLVADLMQRLAAGFSETRASLEQQWDGQDDISTEDLRVALTRYRSFFERLLSA
jgi:hypothetical protein